MEQKTNYIQDIHTHTSCTYNEKLAIMLYVLDMNITNIETKINKITDEKSKQELLLDIKYLYNFMRDNILAIVKKEI